MAVSGRLLYLVLLPAFLSMVTVVLFVGLRMNYFRIWMASPKEKKFLEYQRLAPSRQGPGEQGIEYLPAGSGIKPGDVVNIKSSNDIAVDRAIKDFRHKSCKYLYYQDPLPKATVIIAYGKEERSLLLRALHSVVNRTPPQYLVRVLLVPYGNVTGVDEIEMEVTMTWPEGLVRVIPHDGLGNLYEARMMGVRKAKGEVLVFLDSHCEVAEGWLEPLLSAILTNPTSVAVPVIDQIDPNTLAHTPRDTEKTGGFYFNFTMAWRPLSEQERKERLKSPSQPIPTAMMSGEVFAVAAGYLKSLGGFKSEMYTRGLELEFSFRVWMCGGKIEIQPCSRVAHLAHARDDYDKLSTETEEKAMIQAAEVWMDEYRRFFYMYRKYILSTPYGGDFAKDHLLEERKKCRSFAWYFDEVYKGRFMPDENVYSWGVVRNPQSNRCLSTAAVPKDVSGITGHVVRTDCDHSGNIDQTFSYTFDKTIRQEESLCLSVPSKKGSLARMVDCRTHNVSIIWDYNKDDCVVKHKETGLCLTAVSSEGSRYQNVTIEPCVEDAKNQIWTFLYYLM